MQQFKASNIQWDCSPMNSDELELPSEVIIEAEHEFEVADALSDKYGWSVFDLDVTSRFIVEYKLEGDSEASFFPAWAENREDAVYQCCEVYPEVESVEVFAPVAK